MQRIDFDQVYVAAEGVEPPRAVRPPGLTADLDDLRCVALRDRWGLGLMAIGWVHLATFMACYAMYRSGHLDPPAYLVLWLVELIVVIVMLRRIVTSHGRHKAPPMVGLLARVWITFAILALSVASLNRLTGMPPEWFKPMWCTLSTFGFAMLGWLVSLWFLAPAVQMSLTGMLIAAMPREAYFIYAVSWFVALQAIGMTLETLSKREKTRFVTSDIPESRPGPALELVATTIRPEPIELGTLLSTTS